MSTTQIGSLNAGSLAIGGVAVNGGAAAANKRYLYGVIADVSSSEEVLVYNPYEGNVTGFFTLLEGVLTDADAVVTLTQANDDPMASVTVAFTGSAAGDTDEDTSITNAAVTAGSFLKAATNGGSTGTQRLWFAIEVTLS